MAKRRRYIGKKSTWMYIGGGIAAGIVGFMFWPKIKGIFSKPQA